MIQRLGLWFSISVATIVLSIISILIFRPVFGIDFLGGSLLEIKPTAMQSLTAVSQQIQSDLEHEANIKTTIQSTQDNTLLIRTTPLNEADHKKVIDLLKSKKILAEELRFESIGPTVGQQLQHKAWIAVGLSIVGMIIYIAYAFRRATGIIAPWKFGVAAVYALIHDLLVVTALFGILGHWWGVSVDTLFLTAMLSVMGYSVNDTIVIFDRLKEDWLKVRRADLRQIMDEATTASLMRSINTSITIMLVLIAMVIFGGSTIRWFIVALIAGTVVGTYSSIFVATPCLYFLTKRRQ